MFQPLNKQPPVQVKQAQPKVEHPHEIDTAFAGNAELRKRVHAAIDEYPTRSILFRDISNYILSNSTNQSVVANAEPAAKKRKLDDSNGTQNGSTGMGSLASTATKAWRTIPSISFSIPQRKKLTLEFVAGKQGGIRALGAGGDVEFGVLCRDIDQVFCLPIPEKAKRQHNFIVIPVRGDGVNPVPEGVTAPEPIVWTFEEATGKNIVEGEDPGPAPMAEAIDHILIQSGTGKRVIFPTAEEFESAIPQSHRKGEKAFHVKGFRGSKEGYLFFTSVGIVWGFKKPLAYFSFDSVNAVSYTSVLQRTFNLNIAIADSKDASKTQDIEFGMIDQADYAGIDEYVKNHGLQDASLAAERKAKKLNVNPPAEKTENGTATGEAEGDDGETELQKAERLLQEQEDEEEEDYDPGSEGDSDGSGESDEEDEEGQEYAEGEGEEYEEGYDEEGEEMEG